MPRFLLVLEYDGTCFHGSQKQANARTVQGELERALGLLLQSPVRTMFAGRTDAGVHALAQVATFSFDGSWKPEELKRALNAVLPRDLAVRTLAQVADGVDPRRGALRRRYSYQVLNRCERSPILDRFVWHYPWKVNLDAMREALAGLIGRHWFGAFGQSPSGGHCWRTLWEASVCQQGELLTFVFEADAFLRRMVRLIVGAVMDVGRGRLNPAGLHAALQENARPIKAAAAPAKGLRLEGVVYDKEYLGWRGSGMWWSNEPLPEVW